MDMHETGRRCTMDDGCCVCGPGRHLHGLSRIFADTEAQRDTETERQRGRASQIEKKPAESERDKD